MDFSALDANGGWDGTWRAGWCASGTFCSAEGWGATPHCFIRSSGRREGGIGESRAKPQRRRFDNYSFSSENASIARLALDSLIPRAPRLRSSSFRRKQHFQFFLLPLSEE